MNELLLEPVMESHKIHFPFYPGFPLSDRERDCSFRGLSAEKLSRSVRKLYPVRESLNWSLAKIICSLTTNASREYRLHCIPAHKCQASSSWLSVLPH